MKTLEAQTVSARQNAVAVGLVDRALAASASASVGLAGLTIEGFVGDGDGKRLCEMQRVSCAIGWGCLWSEWLREKSH